MKEIGGYLELDNFIDNEYYTNLIRLNTGRNALLYLIKAKNIKKVYLPYYLCDSVSGALDSNNISYEYYHVDRNFHPLFDKRLSESEYIYIVNYFGQLTVDKISELKKVYNNIIIDNTHDFFQKPILGIDTLYSLRKYFGVPDGAYLSTDSILKENIEIDVSKERMSHVLGRYEGKASIYYNEFKKNDANFKLEPLKYMSKLTWNILKAIDYKSIKTIRSKNYSVLKQKLGGMNKLELLDTEASFAYPFYVENGIELRRKLAEIKIYIPTLWPNVLRNSNKESIEYKYVANILPLPIDQRYNEMDMNYIAEEVIKCIR